MLWLNPSTGDVVEAPKRPSAAWVIVIEVNLDGEMIPSTLEGLRRGILSSDNYSMRPQDIEMDDKTSLDIYVSELQLQKLIKDSKFPYITTTIASDGTLEVRYDSTSKDAAPVEKGMSMERKIDDDDTPFKRGGQRGTGRSGPNGQPSDTPSDTPSDEPSDTPSDEPSDTPSDEPSNTPPDKIIDSDPIEEESEGRDAYQEGQDSAESVSDKLKEKMKERMEGKGKPSDESGEANQPAPDGSEGGAPSQGDSDSQGGQGDSDGSGQSDGGDSDSGDSQEQGEGGADGGGQGQGDGDTDSSGQEGNCDNCSGDSDSDGGDDGDSGEDGSQDGDSDSDSQSDGDSDSEKDSNVIDGDSNEDEKGEKGDKSGDSSEKGDSDSGESSEDGGDSGEEGEGQSDSPPLPPEDEDALNQCVEEAEDGRDFAQEAFQEADAEAAERASDEARRAADEAYDIVDAHEKENEGNDPLDNEKVQEAYEYADEAEEFAQLAKELEEEIKELFDESGLEEEDFEEFKQGLLDELFGEDGEFSDALTEQEKRLLEKMERRSKISRGTIRCVNWETGKIKSFPENETIGDTWIQITKFFSPFETADGAQIVVDRTIEGAVEMINAISNKAPTGMSIDVKIGKNNMSAVFTPSSMGDGQKSLIDALKNMRMFTVKSDGSKITISY